MASTSDPVPKPEAGGSVGERAETAIAKDHLLLYRGVKKAKKERGSTAKERISKMPPCTAGKRSSIYRGVTRHRWTGRYEAHLWDKSTWNQNQNKKGKQVYLGAYDDEEAAARAYDLAALKYWGPGTLINFPVTDYARDLEEMQNLSREEYLASLRRKSSGFSRGVAKYRGLSRWDSSLGRAAASENFSSFNYGDDRAMENDFLSSFCLDRKIDLTSYIKWWGINKTCEADSSSRFSEETKHEDVGSELKTLEQTVQTTEPYKMPLLGTPQHMTKHKESSFSALSVLSQSPAYRNLQEKVFKLEESNTENDENANRSIINRADFGKAVEKSTVATHGVGLGTSGALSIQRSMYPLTSILSAPLLTNYNATLDPFQEPILWTPFVPLLPAGSSHNSEVTKTETTSSTYSFLPPDK